MSVDDAAFLSDSVGRSTENKERQIQGAAVETPGEVFWRFGT